MIFHTHPRKDAALATHRRARPHTRRDAWRRSRLLIGALTVAAWMAAPAFAETEGALPQALRPAMADYAAGAYEEAAIAATETADNAARAQTKLRAFILAARAWLAYGQKAQNQAAKEEAYRNGEAAADRALALSDESAEAHIYKALALGFRSREEGPVNAYFAGYAEAARSHIETALTLEPDNPWALAALGGWHLEALRAGGQLARSLVGASLGTAKRPIAARSRLTRRMS